VLIEAEVRDSGRPPTRERRGRRSRTKELPRSRSTGDTWARSRSSARAPRAGVVAPVLERGDDIVGATPTGSISSRAGAARLSGHQGGSSPPSGSHAHDRDGNTDAAGRSMPVIASIQRQMRVRAPPRGREARVAQVVEQFAGLHEHDRSLDQPSACGPEWSGYQGERRPAWPGGRGFESRLRSSKHAHRPAHHDRRLHTTERRSACRT